MRLAQYIFHGVWGTHWEDLELLRWLTGTGFVDRRAFGEGFRKTNEAGYQYVKMIPFIHYSKLSQALTTRFTCGGQQQVRNKTTFAGKRVHPILYVYNPNNKDHWWGMAGPFLSFMNLFNHRLNEVRNGCEYFPIHKRANEIKQVGIGQYDLNGAHRTLLDGISYPPHKRSATAQSLGPMTQ